LIRIIVLCVQQKKLRLVDRIVNRSSTMFSITIVMLRGEAASLREAEASQPRDCRERTCQTITTL
jgi:hypothetical protein